jgi:heterodisulfide reductase subunit C
MNELLERVLKISGESTFACYQCGKCSSGCPVVESMDITPSQMIKMIQLDETEVLGSKTPWVCVSCLNCTYVCPRGVNVAGVMEALRLISLRKGVNQVNLRAVEDIESMPQILLVAAARKATG